MREPAPLPWRRGHLAPSLQADQLAIAEAQGPGVRILFRLERPSAGPRPAALAEPVDPRVEPAIYSLGSCRMPPGAWSEGHSGGARLYHAPRRRL